ncbi:MAG: hypothetical protein IJI14_14605 [Anaerolineaceae bacterium]|nr:hypothetical protein [Anaerolineaceae bacterium]
MNNETYFYQKFREQFNCSPSSYRELHADRKTNPAQH